MLHKVRTFTHDECPFEQVPQDAAVVVAGLPFALTGAVVLHYVARGRSLPGRLPSHWECSGEPDAWVSKRAAAWTDIAIAAVASGVAASALRPGCTGPQRAGRLALASMVGGVSAWLTVARTASRGGSWVGPLLGLSVVGAAVAPLLGLAFLGRCAQQ